MATTYSNTGYPTRNNTALYWGIGVVVALALIAFLVMRNNRTTTVTDDSAPRAESTTNAPAEMRTNEGTAVAPEAGAPAQMDGREGTETTPTGTQGAGQNSTSTTTTSDVPGNH